MANQKKPAKAKPKPKPKVEIVEVVQVEAKETEGHAPLTKAEEFYIENNTNKTDAELAIDLGKSLPLVQQHLHRTQGVTRINKLMIREKGCTIMTQGASELADQSRSAYVTQQAIENAVRNQQYDEAARLQSLLKVQHHNEEVEMRERQSGHIHYMHAPRTVPTNVRK